MDNIKRTGPSIKDYLTDPNRETWPIKKFIDLTNEDHERVKELALYIGAKIKDLAEELKAKRNNINSNNIVMDVITDKGGVITFYEILCKRSLTDEEKDEIEEGGYKFVDHLPVKI